MRLISIFILFVFFSFLGYSMEAKLEKGIEKLKNKDFLQAQTFFLEVAENAPSFVSFYNLGIVSGELENWPQAKWAFESALKYSPSNGDAQFNAKFVSNKLTDNQNWTHPYPWSERLIVGIGIYTWVTLALASAMFIGFFAFQIISNYFQRTQIKKWAKRLIIPLALLFLSSVYGVVTYNKHFKVNQYAVLKNNNIKLYISPNGIELSDKVKSEDRLNIVDYYQDSTWIQIKTQNDIFWAKTKDLFVY